MGQLRPLPCREFVTSLKGKVGGEAITARPIPPASFLPVCYALLVSVPIEMLSVLMCPTLLSQPGSNFLRASERTHSLCYYLRHMRGTVRVGSLSEPTRTPRELP